MDELKRSVIVMSDLEKCKAIVGGADEKDHVTNMIFEGGGTNMLREITVTFITPQTAANIYSSVNGEIPQVPPYNETIGGQTPTQQFSEACAEGYSQAAKYAAAAVYGAACAGLSYVYGIIDTGSIISSYDNFGNENAGCCVDEEITH